MWRPPSAAASASVALSSVRSATGLPVLRRRRNFDAASGVVQPLRVAALCPALPQHGGARVFTRSIHGRVAGVSPVLGFKRMHDAPTMDPDCVVQTLRELVAERSSDVLLFRALSKRFLASAEEYFPPQMDALLALFAELSYTDDDMFRGLYGRVGDLAAGASPRRVVRLVRNGARLRLPPDEWLPEVLPQLDRHMPNLHWGLPNVLASLHDFSHSDAELLELLLTQGVIHHEDSKDNSYGCRLLERWSRHAVPHEDGNALAAHLLECSAGQGSSSSSGTARLVDTLRDDLNLLAALTRMEGPGISDLEARVESMLKHATVEETVAALLYMERLALRSASLWKACASAVETSLQSYEFVRDLLPQAVHALASLLDSADSEGNSEDLAVLVKFLSAKGTRALLRRCRAQDALHLFRASCLIAVRCKDGGVEQERVLKGLPWSELVTSTARTAAQFSLSERRAARPAAELLGDLDRRHGCLNADAKRVVAQPESSICEMRLAPLAPLSGGHQVETRAEDSQLVPVDAGPEMIWSMPDLDEGSGTPSSGVKVLAHGDTFVGAARAKKKHTPSCTLALRALELRGWQVELRA